QRDGRSEPVDIRTVEVMRQTVHGEPLTAGEQHQGNQPQATPVSRSSVPHEPVSSTPPGATTNQPESARRGAEPGLATPAPGSQGAGPNPASDEADSKPARRPPDTGGPDTDSGGEGSR